MNETNIQIKVFMLTMVEDRMSTTTSQELVMSGNKWRQFCQQALLFVVFIVALLVSSGDFCLVPVVFISLLLRFSLLLVKYKVTPTFHFFRLLFNAISLSSYPSPKCCPLFYLTLKILDAISLGSLSMIILFGGLLT
jgi:hypothetical protein